MRFPESESPRDAMVAALQAAGRNPYNAGDLFTKYTMAHTVTLDMHAARWTLASLWFDHLGRDTPGFTEYLTGLFRQGDLLFRAYAPTPAWRWAEFMAWPADSCEGAFVQNPWNAAWLSKLQPFVRADDTTATPSPSMAPPQPTATVGLQIPVASAAPTPRGGRNGESNS